MQLDLQRTIVAVSSPLAAAERAIVRISGAQTLSFLQQVLVNFPLALKESDHAVCFPARMDLDWFERTIDTTIYLWPDERSFTGEPCAELHFLGSLPIVSKVVQRLTGVGASPAERGEFALRGFLAGKLDLVQAEAILGVIESTQVDQLQWALGQLGGNISQPVRMLRAELMELLAHLEAGLDFVEEDIEFISTEQLSERLEYLGDQIRNLVGQLDSRGACNRDFEIALVGLPNAGKSSLFNQLLGTQRTIVSNIAGTTRDAVCSRFELDGLSINLIDTAGLEHVSGETPRAMAQTVLRDRIQTCDAVLLCIDLSRTGDSTALEDNPPVEQATLEAQVAAVAELLRLEHQPLLTIGTKADLCDSSTEHLKLDMIASVHQPETIEQLRSKIQQIVESQINQQFTQATHHTAVRCRHALQRAGLGIINALDVLHDGGGEELVASELHCVLNDLATIIGEVHNDDILGEIFSRFCIGK